MIKAKHNFLAESIYRIYVSRLLKSNFSKFILLNEYPVVDKEKGIIITPNHFCWWDGFFADYLMRSFSKRRAYLLMLENQLIRYWFFKYVGAFSINTSAPEDMKESMTYARNISACPSDYLIFFPQGEIQAYEKRFISLKRGLINLTEGSDANVLIVSFKIVFNKEKKPSVYGRFGELLSAKEVNKDLKVYENLFLENTEMLDFGIQSGTGRNLFLR